jgi:triacylglycerol lipase
MWVLFAILAVVVFTVVGADFYRWPLFKAASRAQRGRAGLEEKTTHLDGHDIVYLDGGRGEPLILIHGFGANKDNWIQIAPLLSPHFRLIIPDLPGFGDSTRDPEALYGADEQLARLKSFVDSLGLGPVHLGGNSMGGYLAGLFAARYPAQVKSQWLLAPAGVAAAEMSEFFHCVERGENPLIVDNMSDFDRMVDMCFTKTPYVPKMFRRCLCERNIAEHTFNDKIFTEIFSEPLRLEKELEGSMVKTLILWGDGDRLLHPSGAGILQTALGDAELVVMDHMGHCPMLERPRETAALYLRFQGLPA